jgi:hypothetical protein
MHNVKGDQRLAAVVGYVSEAPSLRAAGETVWREARGSSNGRFRQVGPKQKAITHFDEHTLIWKRLFNAMYT